MYLEVRILTPSFPERTTRHARDGIKSCSLCRFLAEEQGQEVIELGLLLGIIAVGLALVVFLGMQTQIKNAFTTWENNSNGLWVPNAPGL